MKKGQWSNIYGDVPDSLRMKVEDTLDRLEEQEMKRRYRVSVVLVAAVLLVLLAGTAVAAGYSALMEYFGRRIITPLEGTEQLIQTDLGEEVQELVSFKIEEAVFDGQTAVVQVLLVPNDLEHHALLNMGLQNTPDSIYDCEITEQADGSKTMRVVGRKDGKEIINYGVELRQAESSTGYQFGMEGIDAQELEDGSVRIWLQGSVIEGSTDKVELLVRSKYDFSAAMNEAALTGFRNAYEQHITLSTPNMQRAAKLIPVGAAKGERFEILSAWLEFNMLSAHLTVEYSYLPDMNKEPMGITFRLYNADENLIAVDSGSEEYLGKRSDGWEMLRSKDEVQAFEKFPERVYLEAKVIGEERVLGRIECMVTEVEAVELSGEPVEREEKRPAFLQLEPVGSWTGDRICLLRGTLRTGRKVELTFTYDGNQEDLADLKVEHKWQDGSLFAAAVSSEIVMKEDCVVLSEILDGNIWPNTMVLEFTRNGEVIDSFECTHKRVWTED